MGWSFLWISPAAVQAGPRSSALVPAHAQLFLMLMMVWHQQWDQSWAGVLRAESAHPGSLPQTPLSLSVCVCHKLTHLTTPLPYTRCVPVRSYLAASCWILLMRLADSRTGEYLELLIFDCFPFILLSAVVMLSWAPPQRWADRTKSSVWYYLWRAINWTSLAVKDWNRKLWEEWEHK